MTQEPPKPSRFNQTALLSSVLIDNIGNGIHTLTMGKLLYDATGSVWSFGASILIEYVLAILLQVVAGSAVDRGQPKRIAVYTDLLRGACVLMAGAAAGSSLGLLFIWICVLAVNAGKPFSRSASFALIPAAVGEKALGHYFSLASACFQAGQLIGIALAGPLLAWGGARAALMVDGGTYVAAAILMATLHVPQTVPSRAIQGVLSRPFDKLKADWLELAVILKKDRAFFWNMLLTSGDFIAISFLNLALVPIVEKRLGGQSYWLTILDGSFALAALVTALFTKYLRRTTQMAVWVLLIEAVCLGVLAVTDSQVVTLAAYLLMGISNAVSLSLFMTSLQYRSVGPIKGRVAGMRHLVVSVLSSCLIPLVSALHSHSLMFGLSGSAVIIGLFAVVTKLAQLKVGTSQSIILSQSVDLPAPSDAGLTEVTA